MTHHVVDQRGLETPPHLREQRRPRTCIFSTGHGEYLLAADQVTTRRLAERIAAAKALSASDAPLRYVSTYIVMVCLPDFRESFQHTVPAMQLLD